MSHGFHEISPSEWNGNAFEKIGKDWMLVSAKADDGTPNTMTASWGGVGVIWNRPVAFVFLRPQRYTTELVEKTGELSLSFFGGEETVHGVRIREALRFCGSHSGRDTDKFRRTGLTSAQEDGIPYVSEADSVLFCKVLYRSELKKSAFLSEEPLSNYPKEDFHNVYICEIKKVLKAD